MMVLNFWRPNKTLYFSYLPWGTKSSTKNNFVFLLILLLFFNNCPETFTKSHVQTIYYSLGSCRTLPQPDAYLGTYQTSMREVKIVKDWKPSTIFAKSFTYLPAYFQNWKELLGCNSKNNHCNGHMLPKLLHPHFAPWVFIKTITYIYIIKTFSIDCFRVTYYSFCQSK